MFVFIIEILILRLLDNGYIFLILCILILRPVITITQYNSLALIRIPRKIIFILSVVKH